ncbi:MAG: Crp/Fnr family transcriptional regulator [bacterium]
MNQESAIGRFKSFLRTLDGYSEVAFSLALPFMHIRTILKGNYFVEAGHTSQHFGFIASGILRTFYLREGEEITTCLCDEEAFATSTASFITQTPSHISVRAIETSTVVTISYHDLQKLYALHSFWLGFGRMIAEKEFLFLENYNLRYSHETAEEKYLRLLREHPGMVNRVPLQYIASYLGIKPETLSRIRKKTAHRIS